MCERARLLNLKACPSPACAEDNAYGGCIAASAARLFMSALEGVEIAVKDG